MIIPETEVAPFEQITPEEAESYVREGVWGDDPATRLVVQDAQRAEQFEMSKAWIMQWSSSQTLYQSPFVPRYWPGTQTEAASISFFTVASSVNSLVPQVMSGLFYENPPFMVQERPGTTAQQARAVSSLLQYQLEDMEFREELRLGVMNLLLFGTAIFQSGWEKFTRERLVVKRKEPAVVLKSDIPGTPETRIGSDELEEEIIEEVVDRPTFEHVVNSREILVDPSLQVPNIQKAKYVIRRRYMTFEDIDKLRDRPGFTIPSREELLQYFLPPQEPTDPAPAELGGQSPIWDARSAPRWEEVTADPTQKPLEVLERWDNKTYIVVLQKKLSLFNGRNEYGKIPFYSIGWWDIPGAFWSMGLGRTIGSEQRLQQGVMNLYLDNASLNLNGVFVRVRGKSIPTQSIRMQPGRIVEVDGKDDFKPLDRLPAVPEAGQILGMSQSRVDMWSGANPITSMGNAGASGHASIARSSAGAQGLLNGAGQPVSEIIDKLANRVIVPFLYDMQEMNRRLLPFSQLQFIMSDELKHEYTTSGGDLVEILNARVKFEILAGSKMQTRRNMAQGLPLLSQFLSNPEVLQQLSIEAKKVNVNEICRMWFEASEWKNINDVIIPMTPQDIQRQQQQSQLALAQTKGAVQSQLQQQKAQAAEELQDSNNIARAARDVLRESFKRAVEPDVLTGEPQQGPVGFGGQA